MLHRPAVHPSSIPMPATPDDFPTDDMPARGSDPSGPGPLASRRDRFAEERPGDEIGPYKLVAQLGEGGFGTVWLAERREPFVQKVALKLVKAGMDSRSVVARFEQERQALAVMNHPHVAKVLDGGLTPKGRPYFAMEYVQGEPISQFCDHRRMSVKDRLRLFVQVCEAVHHAHTKGIIHRDLKPSNVLVSMGGDDRPHAKVIDFGIAKAVSGRMTEQTIFTETGQMIGTPEYMSPEQADPGAVDIDTRTDVYSLGVILYELLSGMLPFDPRDLRSKAYREIQRVIREEDPPAPSARLSTVATKDGELATRIGQARKEGVSALASLLKSELEWIPLKAMRKDRGERYDSAAGLARDVENYLEGHPISAAPESTAYRIRKYARRNKGWMIGMCSVAASLMFGIALAVWQWRVAVASAEAASAARVVADDAFRDAESARVESEGQRRRAEQLVAVYASSQALDAVRAGDTKQARAGLETLTKINSAGRFVDRLASAVVESKSILSFKTNPHCGLQLAVSPDGATIATGDACEKSVRLWDAATGNPKGDPIDIGGRLRAISFTPDGMGLLAASDDRVGLWDVGGAGRWVHTFPKTGDRSTETIYLLAPVGESVFVLRGEQLGELEMRSGRERSSRTFDHLGSFPTGKFAVSPSAKLAVTCGWNSIELWDLGAAEFMTPLWSIDSDSTKCVAFSPDGSEFAVGYLSGAVELRATATGELRRRLEVDTNESVDAVAFRSDSQLIAILSGFTLKLWDPSSEEPAGMPIAPDGGLVGCIAWLPGQDVLVMGSHDGSVRLWDSALVFGMGALIRTPMSTWDSLFCVAPDGQTLVVGDPFNGLQPMDALLGVPLGPPLKAFRHRYSDDPLSGAFSLDGRFFATKGGHAPLQVWDARTWQKIPQPDQQWPAPGGTIQYGRDGALVWAHHDENSVRIDDLVPFRGRPSPPDETIGTERSVRFSFDAADLMVLDDTGLNSHRLQVWDVDAGKMRGSPIELEDWDWGGFALSRDRSKVVADQAGRISLWWLESGSRIGDVLLPKEALETLVEFCPDGETLVSADSSGGVRFWDVRTLTPIGQPLMRCESIPDGLAFSADGNSLAVLESGGVRVWTAVPSENRLSQIQRLRQQVSSVRKMLGRRISEIGSRSDRVEAFASEVFVDDRFKGELRRASLIVIGQVARDAERVRAELERDGTERLQPLLRAIEGERTHEAMQLLAAVAPSDLEWIPPPCLSRLLDAVSADPRIFSVSSERQPLVDSLRRVAEAQPWPEPFAALARAHWLNAEPQLAAAAQRRAIEMREREIMDERDQLEGLDPSDFHFYIGRLNHLQARLAQLRIDLERFERNAPVTHPSEVP